MEGNDEQRRAKAREARAEGKRPSEMGATLGASQQMDQRHEGKESRGHRSANAQQPRPGDREVDPTRDDDRSA